MPSPSLRTAPHCVCCAGIVSRAKIPNFLVLWRCLAFAFVERTARLRLVLIHKVGHHTPRVWAARWPGLSFRVQGHLLVIHTLFQTINAVVRDRARELPMNLREKIANLALLCVQLRTLTHREKQRYRHRHQNRLAGGSGEAGKPRFTYFKVVFFFFL